MTSRPALREAAERADWMQVVLNQGPPCFCVEDNGHFCLRAEVKPVVKVRKRRVPKPVPLRVVKARKTA